MTRTMPPPGQRDFDDLRGDPFLPTGTPLHDKPDAARAQALQEAVERGIAAKQAAVNEAFGDPPDDLPAFLKWKEAVEHWRAAAEQDIRNKVVVGVSPSPTTPPWSRC
jgi:hypothetical protein